MSDSWIGATTDLVTGHSAVVSAALAAVVVWLLVLDDRGRMVRERRPSRRERLSWGLVVAVAGGTVLLRDVLDLVLLVDLGVGVAVVVVASRLVRRARGRATAVRRRTQVVAACDALVAELRSGRPPQVALELVALEWPPLAPVASGARLGGDVPDALRQLAASPGAEPLADVAAAWQVSTRSGAGLADVLDRLGAALREQEDVAREITAAVAPARATAHLLAVLPLVGLGLGTALGGDPLHVLLGTPIGSVLLALGATLAVAGVVWVERLVTAAER